MKQNVALNTIETNMTGQKNFSIKASAKAFKILSSGIYKDKVKAIIREISCNAYDAHVAAGKADIPFDVHLPSYLEPYFYVRDYGTGMTDAQIKKLYTTYFDSTKEQSNEFIGALGIGSKSPFSYTDNYTVTSWDGEYKRVYSCYIGEDGTPSIVAMGKEKSDAAKGIEVRLAVKDGDAKEFEKKAAQVYFWFETLPNGTGITYNFKNDENVKAFENSTYVIQDANIHVQDALMIRMGQVVYPIDVKKGFKDLKHKFKYKTHELDYDYASLGYTGILAYKSVMFNVAIGDVDMTASREDLEYTRHTEICLENTVFGYVDSWLKFLIDGVENAQSYEEAFCIYSGNIILKALDLKWKNMSLNGNAKMRKLFRSPSVRLFDMSQKNSKSLKPNSSMSFDVFNARRNFIVLKDKGIPYIWERVKQYHEDNKATVFNIGNTDDYMVYKFVYGSKVDTLFNIIYMQVDDERLLKVVKKMLVEANIPHIMSSKLPDLRDKPFKEEAHIYEVGYYRIADWQYSKQGGNSPKRYRRIIDPATATGWYVDYSIGPIMGILPKFIAYEKAGYLAELAPKVSTTDILILPQRLMAEFKSNPNFMDLKNTLTKLQDKYIQDCRTTWLVDLQDYLSYQSVLKACNHKEDELVKFLTGRSNQIFRLESKFYTRSIMETMQERYEMWNDLTNNEHISFVDYGPVINLFIQNNPILKVLSNNYMYPQEKIALMQHYVTGVL